MASRLNTAALAALSRRGLLVGAGALAGFTAFRPGPAVAQAGAAGATGATPYPLATFFAQSKTRSATLSPDGRRIAILEQLGTEDEPLGIIDMVQSDDPEGPRHQIHLGATKTEALEWGNNDRLLVRVAMKGNTGTSLVTGSNIRAKGSDFTSRRVFSIGADGSNPAVMFQDQRRRLRHSLDMGRVIDLLPEDNDHVLMTAWERDGILGLHKVNINTGSAELIERGGPGTYGWQTQSGVAVMRFDTNSRATVQTILARAPGETEWKLVRRSRFVDAPDFSWVAETGRPGVVLVTARIEGEDTETVRELDLTTLGFGPPMNNREGRDVLYGLRDSANKYLGAAYYGERLEYAFIEPEMAVHHRALNRFFDNDCDVHLTDVDIARNRFIAHVTGPREPGAWFFYDRTARKIVPVGAAHVFDIDRLAGMETLQVRTRDGATIEAYLTAPPGGQPGPLVVLPHGGPEVRDIRTWDRQVQGLAAQGWWVLRPNFRGSGGYGLGFAREGWERWGDRMQEDVEDAVVQAIALRGLDAGKVAIMGTSYGGYAALMGAVRRPDLYKAAISICGVGDLPDMLAWENREDDTPGKPIYEFWTKRIGDPQVIGSVLEQASPRRRAAEVVCPVLLVHGVDDTVVPVMQSRRMRAALREAGKTVELVEIPDFGHADWPDSQELALMNRYVALLRQAFA